MKRFVLMVVLLSSVSAWAGDAGTNHPMYNPIVSVPTATVPVAALPVVPHPAVVVPTAPTVAPTIPTPDDPSAFFSAVVSAFAGKQWGYLLAMFVMAIAFALRKWGAMLGPKVEEWLHSDPGGVMLAFLASFATALGASALAKGGGISWELLAGAFKVAIGAMGGFSLLNKFLLPVIKPAWNWFLKKIGNGKAQVAEVINEAAATEANANAKPVEPGTAAKNMDEIK